MTTLVEPLLDVDWGSLKPPCDAEDCPNLGDFPVEKRHLHPVSCEEEHKNYWICTPCYEQFKKLATACMICGVPAAMFKT